MKIVITERNTIEGFTAGWVAMRLLKEEAKWIQVGQNDKLPDVDGADVLMFGISYPRGYMKRLQEKAKTIRHFDNSWDARQEIGGLRFCKFETSKTAARMAWNHIRGTMSLVVNGRKIFLNDAPWIVDYSDERTLWKWPNVKHYFVRLAIIKRYKAKLTDWDSLAVKDLMIVEGEGLAEAKKQHEQKEKEKDDKEQRGESEQPAEGKETGATEPSKDTKGDGEGQPKQPGRPKVSKVNSGKTQRSGK